MIVTVIVAGTGGYFLGRILRLGVLGCAMVGTVFELSGPFVGWLGWPHAAVFSWAGWLFAAAVLIVRVGGRFAPLPSSRSCWPSRYAGQPEVLVVLVFALAVFLSSFWSSSVAKRNPIDPAAGCEPSDRRCSGWSAGRSSFRVYRSLRAPYTARQRDRRPSPLRT